MKARNVSRLLIATGIVLILAGFVWWYATHDAVMTRFGGSAWDASECLFYRAPPTCQSVRIFVAMAGYPAFHPVALWGGAAALVAGLTQRYRNRPKAREPIAKA
jgi:hypothetical protein